MKFNQDEQREFWNPYYKIMELSKEELLTKLNTWSRLELIDWLSWNIEMVFIEMKILDNILGKTEAIEIMTRQIHS